MCANPVTCCAFDTQAITRGIPQEICAGLSYLLTIFHHCTQTIVLTIMYADDSTLLIKNDSAEDLIANSLILPQNAFTHNELSINLDKKTQVYSS